MNLNSRLFSLLIASVFVASSAASNWPAWRGPFGNGTTREKNLPTHWSTNENVRWRVALPERGNSTPIVWGNRVFVAQADGNRRTLMCFDRADGKQLWQTGVAYEEKEPTHSANPYCSATPVTDGKRVVVYFGSAGLFCYDFKGKELWRRDVGKVTHEWGYGASPLLHGDLCILNRGPGENAGVIAVNKQTGAVAWEYRPPKADPEAVKKHFADYAPQRPNPPASDAKPPGEAPPPQPQPRLPDAGSWSTPIVVRASGRDEVVVNFPLRVIALDAKTGKELWHCEGLTPLAYSSPVMADGLVIGMGSGFSESWVAVKPGGDGDVSERRAWDIPKIKSRIGSGVVHDGHVYAVAADGIAQCVDAKTGKVVWEERLRGPTARNSTWSSAVVANGLIYIPNQAGDVFVLKASPQFEVISTNSMAEPSNSSVAVSDGELFIRTDKTLWCISRKKA